MSAIGGPSGGEFWITWKLATILRMTDAHLDAKEVRLRAELDELSARREMRTRRLAPIEHALQRAAEDDPDFAKRFAAHLAAFQARVGNDSKRSVRPPATVPSAAEAIIDYICSPDRKEAVLGDLQSGFTRITAKRGEKAARRWYWWQTTRTAAAFGMQMISRLVLLRTLLGKLGL